MKTDEVFPSEGAMQTSLRKASVSIFCQAGEPWVILDERGHSSAVLQMQGGIPGNPFASPRFRALVPEMERKFSGGWKASGKAEIATCRDIL
ncbi:MAG: hypothetical protein ACRDLL_06550 [Solirubrobacterales bacterium]